MKITSLVYDGFDELDGVGPYETFAKGAEEGADLTVSLATLDGDATVTASHGLRLAPDGVLSDSQPDLIVVPGGGWNTQDGTGAWAEAERGDVLAALTDAYANGTTLAGVCTGGMLLARAGLLDGRPATTHGGAKSELEAYAGEVVDARVVDDGDVLTAGGVTSGLDLALHVLDREFGTAVAERVATRLEYEPRGHVYRTER